MGSLIDNKDRILLTFDNIYDSILNKNPEAIKDVNLYASQIANIEKKEIPKLKNIGDYYVCTASNSVNGFFTMNETGAEYFITNNNKNIVIKEGYFLFFLCAGEVTPVSKTFSNCSLKCNGVIKGTISNSSNINFVYSEIYKTQLFIGDEIEIYSYKSASSGTPSSSVSLSNLAMVYLLAKE